MKNCGIFVINYLIQRFDIVGRHCRENIFLSLNLLCYLKPGFHMSGKSQSIWDFTFCRRTIPDFDDISDIRQRSVPDFRETIRLFVIGGLAPSNLGDW